VRATWKDFQRRYLPAAGRPRARSRCSTRQRWRPPATGGGPVLHLLTRWSLRTRADRPAGSSALGRSRTPRAYC